MSEQEKSVVSHPETLYAYKTVAQGDDPYTHISVDEKPEEAAYVDRVKIVGVYKLVGLVEVSATVMVKPLPWEI